MLLSDREKEISYAGSEALQASSSYAGGYVAHAIWIPEFGRDLLEIVPSLLQAAWGCREGRGGKGSNGHVGRTARRGADSAVRANLKHEAWHGSRLSPRKCDVIGIVGYLCLFENGTRRRRCAILAGFRCRPKALIVAISAD